MDDKKEQVKTKATWKHDQELSFKKVTPHLELIREALQKAISHEKMKLQQMVNAQNSIRNK